MRIRFGELRRVIREAAGADGLMGTPLGAALKSLGWRVVAPKYQDPWAAVIALPQVKGLKVYLFARNQGAGGVAIDAQMPGLTAGKYTAGANVPSTGADQAQVVAQEAARVLKIYVDMLRDKVAKGDAALAALQSVS